MKIRHWTIAFVLSALFAVTATANTTISKPPDQGPFWHPVGNEPTYVYADCFYAPAGPDAVVTSLGTWLLAWDAQTPHALVRFEIWGTTGAGGPDCSQVIAATASMSTEDTNLNLYTLPVVSGGGPLTAGTKYFFVVTGVGMGDGSRGQYQVGAHTQNSIYNDNCTFWYSNDPTGCPFDGQGLTPEMAFEVTLTSPVSVETVSWGGVKALYR